MKEIYLTDRNTACSRNRKPALLKCLDYSFYHLKNCSFSVVNAYSYINLSICVVTLQYSTNDTPDLEKVYKLNTRTSYPGDPLWVF